MDGQVLKHLFLGGHINNDHEKLSLADEKKVACIWWLKPKASTWMLWEQEG